MVVGEGKADLAQDSSCIFGEEAGSKLGKLDADVSAGASPLCPSCGSPKTWFVGGL